MKYLSQRKIKITVNRSYFKSSLELIKEKLNGCKIQADEISSIIKERIDNFELNVDVNETGKIISYADGIAQVYGLKNVMAGEVVEFENGEKGNRV